MSKFTTALEQAVHDCVAGDYHALGGTKIFYFALRRSNDNVNAVYDEPKEEYFDKFEVVAIVDFPEVSEDAQESGVAIERNTTLSLARVQVEQAGIPFPKIGDVVEVPGGLGSFYDVKLVQPEGFLDTLGLFTGFTLTIVRRNQFVPERKIVSGR